MRGFERFLEVLRGFERFSEVFQRPSQRPSQSAIFLSELRVVLPPIVLPLKTPAKNVPQNGVLLLIREHRKKGGGKSVVWEGFPCANPLARCF